MTDAQKTGLQKTQDVVGKPVISLQGEEIGSVSRVIVDPGAGKIVGLTVNVKGWFKGEKCVEFESVNSAGDYAVTVRQSSHVLPLNDFPALEKLAQDSNMYNMRIITPEGKLIGTVSDFYFDSGTGKIERYILTGGVIKNLFKGRASIPADSIESIGKDAIIAAGNVEDMIQKEETGLQDNIGQWKDDLENLKGDLEHWKDDFEKVWDKTRSNALELSKSIGGNIKEVAQTGKGRGRELLAKTQEIISEKKIQLRKSYEFWMDRLQSVKEKPLSEDDINTLLGHKAGKTVTDDNGNVIIAENSEVTSETVEQAQKTGKIKELLISVATKDLEDQMESIENEEEKLQ